jgi:hypothetical protein
VKRKKRVGRNARDVKDQSCPIQDEPEGGIGFQYKMSLKRGDMLRIDNQRARSREVELGADRGFSKS